MFCYIYLALVLSSLRGWYFLFVFDWFATAKKRSMSRFFFDNIVLEKEKWFAFEYLNKSALKGIKLCVWGLFQSAPSQGSCHQSKGNHFSRSRSSVLAPQFIFEILEKFSYWQERSERFYWFYLSVMIIWYPINRYRMPLCSNLVKRIVGSLQRIEKAQRIEKVLRSNSLQFVSEEASQVNFCKFLDTFNKIIEFRQT